MNLATNDLAGSAWSQIWQVTVLLAIVAVATRLACHRRPHLAYVLWMLVVLKCLTPPVWSSPTGLFSWAQCRVTPARADVRSSDAGVPLAMIEEPLVVTNGPEERRRDEPSVGLPAAAVPVAQISPIAAEPPPSSWRDQASLVGIVAAVWVLGSLVLAGLMWWKWSAYRRLLGRTTLPGDATVERLAAELCVRLRLRRKVQIVITSEPFGPAVFGLLRPVVVLPLAIVAGKTPQQIEPILAHELVHLRRGDTYWGATQLAVEVLWWFHPLVWWANRQTCRERERCCDEEVVAGLKCGPAAYARCLLDVLELQRNWQPMLAISEVRSAKVTSNRLEDIMNRSESFHAKTPRWSWALLLLAAVLVLPGRAMVLSESQADKPNQPRKSGATQSRAEPTPDKSAPRHDVTDTVLVVGDGRPVTGAEVQACDAFVPLQTFRSDERGEFHIPRKWLAAKDYHGMYFVAREGESVGWRGLFASFQSGHERRDASGPIRIEMLPRSRTIKGNCVDSEGRPLAGATVRVLSLRSKDIIGPVPFVSDWLGTAISDENGDFSLRIPDYQTCSVVAEHPKYVPVMVQYSAGVNIPTPSTAAAPVAHAQLVRPAANAATKSEPLIGHMYRSPGPEQIVFHEVAAGWVSGAAITVQAQTTKAHAASTSVVGQVVDSAGKAIPDAQAAVVGRVREPSTDSLLVDDLRLLGSTKADGEGRFHLNIPKLSSAAYYSAHAVAVADGYNLGWQPIGLDVARPQVKVALGKEQTIHGRVVDALGKPAADVKVYVTSIGRPLPGDFDGIQCWKPPSQLPFWPKPVMTDAEGRFTLRGVDRSGILSVQVRDDRFAIDWRQIGLAGEKDAHVAVSPAGEVTLSPPPARIFEGKISYDDTHQPVAKARVEIGASFDPFRCIMNMGGQTDADGRFRLNPYSGKIFFVKVCPPAGEPYLTYEKEIKLADRQQPPNVDIALPRGVLLRGKITEKATGKPVAGAAIKYEDLSRPPYRPDRILPDHSSPAMRGITRSDGTYQIAVPPGRGTLFVQGPGSDYVRQTINTRDFNRVNVAFSRRHYVAAYSSVKLTPNQEPAELNLAIRRGATVHGTIVGPDNQPPGDVLILSRHFIGVGEDQFRGGNIRAKNGQFALHGLDPDVATPFYFLDPKHETGATVEISGKSADNGPLVIHLQPCGKAVARFVTPDGKPAAKRQTDLSIVVSPGPFLGDEKRNKKEVSSDQDFVANFDRQHYWHEPTTDAKGRCTFPALIPGATYRIPIFNKLADWDEKDFTVKPGETLQLPDIAVKHE
jgi:beta-lactamase regulating signal transducer with metallopeptidase domain